MVDGKSTSAKSGLEFTTPRFPALQAHVPSLSPPPAPWKYHGAEASAPSQYCVSTSLGEPQPPATKTREHASHEALTQLKALLSRAPCTTLITPLPSSPAKFAFTKLLSEGKGSEHLPHANSSTKGGASSVPTGDGPHQAQRPLHCSVSGWDHGSTAEETRITYCQHHTPQEVCNSDKEVGDRAAPH